MNENKPYNVVEDIATITTIPVASLNKLCDKTICCICNNVEENLLAGQYITESNIGCGSLIVSVENDSIQYKFVPSKKFERALVKTVNDKKNPLVVILENTFANRIVKTYKDMF